MGIINKAMLCATGGKIAETYRELSEANKHKGDK
jgi:hypothetical protein